MRNYRFRVYNPADETMTYNVGLDRISEYADETLVKMQQTGLKDRNGTNIYEGDVVKGQYVSSPYPNLKFQRIIGKVCYSGVKFRIEGVKQYEYHHCDLDSSFEVIGNIFDTPELLKQENGEEVKG